MSIRTIGRPKGYQYPIGLAAKLNVVEEFTSGNGAIDTTGGTQTIDASNTVHKFTSSGFFTPSFTGNVEYMIIAGGGGGGYGGGSGGGGGAGGFLYSSNYPVAATANVRVIVGGGGGPQPLSGYAGYNGTNSSIGIDGVPSSNVEASGGGGGGGGPNDTPSVGQPGGSGGGGGTRADSTPYGGGSAVSGQGNPGGTGLHVPGAYEGAGGGGGAGGPGGNSSTTTGGAGGIGVTYSISGSPVNYAGGGGGGGNSGAPSASVPYGAGIQGPGKDASVNRGSGGGGDLNARGGSGGSGIIVIRYLTTQNVLGYANTFGYTIN